MNIDDMIEKIIDREGGFVDDPDDLGGATNMGVTIGTLRRLGVDVNGDGIVDVNDVKELTKQDVSKIYKQQYFYAPRISELPEAIQETVFDMYINAGSNAIKILQNLLTEMGFECGAADGAIGKMTIRACDKAFSASGNYLADAYAIERRNYYFRLGDKRPASRKYCVTRKGDKGGWIRRAEEFMKDKYKLTNEQFSDRVKAWG